MKKESLIVGFAVLLIALFFFSSASSLTGNVVLEDSSIEQPKELHEVYRFEFTQILLLVILLVVVVWYYYSR